MFPIVDCLQLYLVLIISIDRDDTAASSERSFGLSLVAAAGSLSPYSVQKVLVHFQ